MPGTLHCTVALKEEVNVSGALSLERKPGTGTGAKVAIETLLESGAVLVTSNPSPAKLCPGEGKGLYARCAGPVPGQHYYAQCAGRPVR